jgi:hypothetical protein
MLCVMITISLVITLNTFSVSKVISNSFLLLVASATTPPNRQKLIYFRLSVLVVELSGRSNDEKVVEKKPLLDGYTSILIS